MSTIVVALFVMFLDSAHALGGHDMPRPLETAFPAWIVTRREDSLLLVQGYARNRTGKAAKIRYMLKVVRIGQSGSVSTCQEGFVSIPPGKSERLCISRLSFSVRDRVDIELRLFIGKTVVARRRLSYI